jgi:uncharacterized repeat protein (TIGR03803 family)
VFELTPGDKLTTLYSFCDQCGAVPYFPIAGPIQATNGDLYGTASNGPSVFEVTAQGTLASFDLSGGYDPVAALIQATNGDLYGTTSGFPGTVFKITIAGVPTTLYNFCSQTNCADGVQPYSSLVQAVDGSFYGTTFSDGAGTGCNPSGYNHGCGTVFKITPMGELTTLHSFSSPGGNSPIAGLAQGTDGRFYGTTNSTIFSLDVGLGPFVRTVPMAAKAGAKVIVLGTNLSGATRVTFNNTPARFEIISLSEITTTVPAGATTGTVKVTLPNGTLSGNVPFYVIP